MIFDAVFADERDQAQEWRAEAARRRVLWPEDPVATVFAFCAGELEERVRRQELRTAQLTVREFAQLRRVSQPTVRRWIQKKRIQATWTSDGWSIARTEEPTPVRRRVRRVRLETAA